MTTETTVLFAVDWQLGHYLSVLVGFGAAFHASPVPNSGGQHYHLTVNSQLCEKVLREVEARVRELGTKRA